MNGSNHQRFDNGGRAVQRPTEAGHEIVELVGPAGDEIFVVHHVPKAPRAGVLICSSILNDTILNYRREIELARSLALRNIAVTRFNYRGTGHSGGDQLTMTFEAMLEDAATALKQLSTRFSGPIGIVGTRWGGLVAAATSLAARHGPIALWEPVLRAEEYFREAFSASSIASMTAGARGPSPVDRLNATGHVDVLGFLVGKPLYDSATGLDVESLLIGEPTDLLYVTRRPEDGLTAEERATLSVMRERGHRVVVEVAAGPRAWWFIENDTAVPLDSVISTAGWLEEMMLGSPP